jgi:hypothetical protein
LCRPGFCVSSAPRSDSRENEKGRSCPSRNPTAAKKRLKYLKARGPNSPPDALIELRGELGIATAPQVAEILDGLAPAEMACVTSFSISAG